MKASRLVEVLQAAIAKHGDLEVVVAYDGSQVEIEDATGRPDDGFGPRQLNVTVRGMSTTLPEEMPMGTPVVFEL